MTFKQLFTCIALMLCFTSLMAESIEKYDINVTVQQSGALLVTERILYDFGAEKKHGMFRDIPFQIKRYGMIRDIRLSDFAVTMDGEKVEWSSLSKKTDKSGFVRHVKIGSHLEYVTGKHEYRIEYTVGKGVLPASQNEENDAIRWNVIGTGWNILIKNIHANFYLPPSLHKENITVHTYTGTFGETYNIAKHQWLSSSHLEVTVPRLFPQNGLTVEMAYPANRLDQNGLDNVSHTLEEWIDRYGYIMIFFIYFALFYVVTKILSGKVDNRSVVVQYDPPKGMNVLQSGMLYDGRADKSDMVPAILELAYLGYLKILKKEETSTATLKKIDKPRKGLSKEQIYLLDKILFKGKEQFSIQRGTEKEVKALQKGFSDINRMLEKWSQKENYMQEDPKKTRTTFLLITITALLPYVLMTIASQFTLFGSDAIFMVSFPIVFGVPIVTTLVSKEATIFVRFVNIAIGAFVFTPLYFFPLKHGVNPYEVMFGPMAILICTLVLWVYYAAYFGAKYDEKGVTTKKYLDGLKKFMYHVKKDEIKRRLAEDPAYLEKLLPYAMIFGMSDHWLKLFDTMDLASPQWYSGDLRGIPNMHSAMSTISRSQSRSSGGGGYSGGGGSSGGGSGGGGGGSW